MPRYMIIRTFEVDEEAMPDIGRRSKEIVEQLDITWEHSHVVVDERGTVKTFCIYEAPDEGLVREHGVRLGKHTIDSIEEIAGDVTPADFPG